MKLWLILFGIAAMLALVRANPQSEGAALLAVLKAAAIWMIAAMTIVALMWAFVYGPTINSYHP